MSTRRSTRRTAASAEPTPPALEQSSRDVSPAVEPARKKGRKGKAAAAAVAHVESPSSAQSQSTTKVSVASRVTSASTTTTAATAVSKRTTRAAKAAGDGSPLRVYQSPERKRKRARGHTASATPEPTQAQSTQDDDENDDDDDQGIFFSKTIESAPPSPSDTDHFFSLHDDTTVSPSQNDNEAAVKADNDTSRNKISQLEARIIELEKANFNLVNENERVVGTYDGLQDKIGALQREALKQPPRSLSSPSLFSPSSDPRNVPRSAKPVSPFSPFSKSPSPHVTPWAAPSSRPASTLKSPSFSHCLQSQLTASRYSLSASSPISQPVFPPISQSVAPPSIFKVDIPKRIDDTFAAMAAGKWDFKTNKLKANTYESEFDTQLLNLPTTSPATRAEVSNSSESAAALLKKIEDAAKEPPQCDNTEANSSLSDPDVNMELVPQPLSTKRTYEESATPVRRVESSSFFTRSFSAIKSIKSLFSTPAPKAISPLMVAPPPNSLTETLSTPPTPVGERTRTPAKKKKTDHMMRTLLKGIDPADERKAEEWARQVIPSLKNDNAFRAKRKRLETPLLLKDLNNFPASKPWETGFGDPLADLDDDDVVPVWAVYLDMVAEEEERAVKKHKSTHGPNMGFEDVPTINEQYATSQGTRSSRPLFDSHGQSASDLDFHPRRSIVPSPMFDTSLSHHQGGNVFKELQGHDSAAKIRTSDREVLQSASKASAQTHNPGMGSFSVPDDSDEDDSTIISETDENVGSPAVPVWTQAPPPAPVPAHAPLPGGAAADASSTSTEKPVDEIERQRQKLMKHTPAKPSRLREATYPSPSLLSDAGNESILMATPAQTAAAMNSIFNSMPGAEVIELNSDEQAAFDAIVASDAYKQQLATPWAAPIISYDSDEEDLSPL